MKVIIILFIFLPYFSMSQTFLCEGQGINETSNTINDRMKLFVSRGQGWVEVVSSYQLDNSNASYAVLNSNYSSYRVNGKISFKTERWILRNFVFYNKLVKDDGSEKYYTLIRKPDIYIIPNELCETEKLAFPNMINTPQHGTYKFYQGGNSRNNVTNANPVDLLALGLNTGSLTVRFEYTHLGCSFYDEKQNINLELNPTISINGSLPDTITQGDSLLLNTHITHNGDSLTSTSIGIIKQGSSLYFNSNFSDTGLVYFCVDVNKNTCNSNTCDSIYVKYNPGAPSSPFIYSYSKKDSIIHITGGGTDRENTPIYNLFKNPNPEFKSYVCQNKIYSYRVLLPKVNQPNPSDNLTYHWYEQRGGNVTFLGIDTIINYTTPNINGNSDSVLLICKAQNSLGVFSGSVPLKLIIQGKPNFFLNDTVCYYMNDTSLIKTYIPNYFIYPQLMDSLMTLNSITREIYQNGNLTPGIDTLVINNSPLSKIKNIVLKSTINAPYSKIDTLVSSGVFFTYNGTYYIKNHCTCDYYDTILYVQSPIPGISYTGNDTVGQNEYIQIANTSIFYDSTIWKTSMDEYLTNYNTTNFSQFSGVWGNHDFHLTLLDNYGCLTDTSIVDLFYCKNPLDSIRLASITENNNIQHFKLYPNPVVNNANVEFTTTVSDYISIKILDINGRVVGIQNQQISQGNNKFTLNTNALNRGVYIVHFNNQLKGYFKLIKQ